MSDVMQPFEFRTVPSMLVEWSGAQRLGETLSHRFTARKALIVTDGGLVKAGLLKPVEKNLRDIGFDVVVFDRVIADHRKPLSLKPHVSRGSAHRYRDWAWWWLLVGCGKAHGYTGAVGTGSRGLYGIDNVLGERLPLVQIPTTAGTGSEVTNIAILTTGETTKMGVVSRQLYCDFVLLDAELTVGLPATHTAATGIDAMVHAIESYTSKHKKNPLSDALAREALRLISQHLVTACHDGSNRHARESFY